MFAGNLPSQALEGLVSINPVVIKSHDLIDARFPSLTLKEKQLFLLAISLISPDAPVDRPIRVCFPRHYLEMVFGSSNYTSAALLGIAEGLVNRSIQIKGQKEGEWEVVNIMGSAKYQDGQFSMTFNLALNEHFLSLRPITKYQLALVADLSSFYQIRLYEILLKEIEAGELAIDLATFRRLSGLDGRYSEYRAMKRCVLLPAVAAVSEHTDIVVDFKEIRAGRAVTGLHFTMRRKRDLQKQVEESEERRAMRAALEAVGFGPELIDIVLGSYQGDLDQLRASIAAARRYIERGEANGEYREPIAVYRAAIRDGWGKDRAPRNDMPRKKKPAPASSTAHPSHKPAAEAMRAQPPADPREAAIDALLLRMLADGHLYQLFMVQVKKEGLLDVIEKLTLEKAGRDLPMVREQIWKFGEKLRETAAA